MFLIYARELLGWMGVGGEEIEIFIYFPPQIEFSFATTSYLNAIPIVWRIAN